MKVPPGLVSGETSHWQMSPSHYVLTWPFLCGCVWTERERVREGKRVGLSGISYYKDTNLRGHLTITPGSAIRK